MPADACSHATRCNQHPRHPHASMLISVEYALLIACNCYHLVHSGCALFVLPHALPLTFRSHTNLGVTLNYSAPVRLVVLPTTRFSPRWWVTLDVVDMVSCERTVERTSPKHAWNHLRLVETTRFPACRKSEGDMNTGVSKKRHSSSSGRPVYVTPSLHPSGDGSPFSA